jgi:MSHA biogenesis protein MshL
MRKSLPTHPSCLIPRPSSLVPLPSSKFLTLKEKSTETKGVKVRPLHGIGVGVAVVLMAAQGAAQAPAGQTLKPLAVTQLEDRQQTSDLDDTKQISLTVSEPAALTDLLLVLTRDTRLSVVPDPDVAGTFRGDLKNVTLRQAIEMILEPYGFDYSVQGNIIRVFKRRVETRIFDLNYVATRRSASRSLAASSSIGSASVETTRDGERPDAAGPNGSSTVLRDGDAADLLTDLATGMQTLLSSDGKFNLDRKAALLQVSDYPDRLDKVSLYLDAVHNRASRQVSIQAKVIEIALNDDFLSGINWNLAVERAGDSVSTTQPVVPAGTTGTFATALNIKDLSGLLNALAAQGKVNVLASPRVNVLNNEPAVMRVGTQDVFFRTTSQVDATTGRILQTTEPQSVTEGVVLSVTPQVSGDGMINLSISPSLTERTGQAVSRFGDAVPILSVREADTLVRVHENETIVIAGLTEERPLKGQAKVPVIGAVPGIGSLFRRETRTMRKTDLVILLTPSILTPARVAETVEREQHRMSESIR